MSLMENKVFKYILNFFLRFTECCFEIICFYQLDSVFRKLKDILGGL